MNPDNAKPRSRGDRAPKLEDVLPMLKIPNKWITIRLMPNVVLPIKQHWIDILAGKDKRAVRIPKICVSFDPETEQPRKGIKCPYCELGDHADDSPIYILAETGTYEASPCGEGTQPFTAYLPQNVREQQLKAAFLSDGEWVFCALAD